MTRQAAIAGIGALPFSRNLGKPEQTAALEAILLALDDAGMSPDEVDGIMRTSIESTTDVHIAFCLGIPDLRFFGEVGHGGGSGCALVGHAAMAVELGVADVVVVYRARNRSSGGRPWAQMGAQPEIGGDSQWSMPFGIVRPVDQIALLARRYMHDYPITERHFGEVAVAARFHASRNPAAQMRDPITLDDHASSRPVSEPLRLLDCCLESDGALAFVITTLERARSAPHSPAVVRSYAQGTGPEHVVMTSYHSEAPLRSTAVYAARSLYARCPVTPADIQCAQLYDAFSPLVLMSLEAYGFCAEGEGGSFAEGGALQWPEGRLPVNTSGGSLSEAYVHGFNLIAEGVRQVRGTSTSQVAGLEHCLVTSGNGVPTSALILGADRR
jgi:acetyl-CoA acetyltransferase